MTRTVEVKSQTAPTFLFKPLVTVCNHESYLRPTTEASTVLQFGHWVRKNDNSFKCFTQHLESSQSSKLYAVRSIVEMKVEQKYTMT